MRRRESFRRAFDAQCMGTGKSFESMPECAEELQAKFGFPDKTCPGDSPADLYARDLPPPLLDEVAAAEGGEGKAADAKSADGKPAKSDKAEKSAK